MRENVGREGAEAVERLARSLGLHFKPYGRGTNTVLVVSKTPLPDYRADLDARRNATRDVEMSDDARRVVAAALERAETHRPAATKHEEVQRLGEEQAAYGPSAASRRLPPPPNSTRGGGGEERARRASPRALASALERARLPAAARRDAFLAAVAADQVTVVSGETSCGKTTQCPQFVLERALAEGRASATYVVCTQPRRISAVSVAARVAHERGEAVAGATVGSLHPAGGARSRGNAARLEFCTTGASSTSGEEPDAAGRVARVRGRDPRAGYARGLSVDRAERPLAEKAGPARGADVGDDGRGRVHELLWCPAGPRVPRSRVHAPRATGVPGGPAGRHRDVFGGANAISSPSW